MKIPVLDRIRRFQEHVLEVGLAQAVLSLPAPRMLALLASGSETASVASIYGKTVTEREIESVSRDLFASGHYSLAVQESYKAVEKFVQQKSAELGLSGTKLMQFVFSTTAPKLYWTERKTQSEQDEQQGYLMLYGGAMLGIRNPVTHEFGWVDDPIMSLELILFAQHLLRKAKIADVAQVATKLPSPSPT
jgi:uncharacterized protein (TIGR02391 family)